MLTVEPVKGVQKLICGACNVTWQGELGEPCWICEGPGTSAWTGPHWRLVQPLVGDYTERFSDD